VTTDQVLSGVGLIVVLAVGSQVLASRLRIPALIVLLPAGFTAGALTTDVDPQRLLGASFQPLVSLALFSTQQNLRADHAGFASRFIAFVFDCAVSIAMFLLVLGAASFAASVLTGGSIYWHRGSLWVALAFWGWSSSTTPIFWTTSGKTPGMTLLGVRVVGYDGSGVAPGAGSCERWCFR
jgi:hypothetical protein